MKLKVLVGVIENVVTRLDGQLTKPHPSQDDEYFYNQLRRLFIGYWKTLLAQLSAKRFNQDAPITSQQVELISNHLKRNWDYVQSSDLVPVIKINDEVFTQVPMDVVKFLAEIAHVTSGIPAMQMLMPTADFTRLHPMSKKVLAKQSLQDLQLSDDNKTVLHVTYDFAVRQDGRVILHHGETLQDGSAVMRQVMTDNETNRLKNHSEAATEYFAQVNNVKGSDEEIAEQKLLLKQTYIEKQMDTELKVTAHYTDDHKGFSGLSRVKKVLNKNVDNLFESREELYNHLRYCLKPDQWEDFINTITSSVLLQLMTDNENKNNLDAKPTDKIKTTLKANEYSGDKHLFANDQTYADAVHLCMMMTYGRYRAMAGTVTSIAGTVSSMFGGGYTDAEKLEVVNESIPVLTGRSRYGKPIPDRDKFFESTKTGASNDQTLGILCAHMRERELAKKSVPPENQQVLAKLVK